MNGVIDLSFDDEVSVYGGVRTDVISLIDESQEDVDGGSSTALRSDYGTSSSVSKVQSKKRRRASKNSVARSSANNVNKSSLKKRISDSQKKKIEEANKAVEKISEEVKTLREKLASAEKELQSCCKDKAQGQHKRYARRRWHEHRKCKCIRLAEGNIVMFHMLGLLFTE